MSIFGRLFGSKAQPSTEPPRTVKELLAARAPPWNRVAQTVINSVLEAITDKGLLEAFVRLSMNVGLVPRYEALGGEDADPRVIRAQISQILCETGNRALPPLGESIAAGRREAAIKALTLADDAFEAAIALAEDQIAAYIGLAELYRLVGKRAESQNCAKLGLARLEQTGANPAARALRDRTVLHAGILDEAERQLRTYLEP